MGPSSKPDAALISHFHFELLPAKTKRLYIAFSGGIDSVVLLHLVAHYHNKFALVLWHINHGLQQNAQHMEHFARGIAREYGVEFRVDRLNLDQSRGNLEARARSFRYKTFEQQLTATDALLTAHHMNDQAETLLLNLMRGSGVDGLSAIARSRSLGQGILYRPMLDINRQQIESYAQAENLHWIDDPSNSDTGFDRNYLRHKVLPLLIERWPAAVSQLHRVCDWQNETSRLISDLASIDFERNRRSCEFTEYDCLHIEGLLELSIERQKNLIRYWLNRHNKEIIGYKRLQELLKQLLSRRDAMPLLAANGYSLRPYRGHVYIVDNVTGANHEDTDIISMNGAGAVNIPFYGIKKSRQDILDHLSLNETGQDIYLQFRRGIRDVKTSHAHKLKRLYHKHHIPPWIRPLIPKIMVDGTLVGLWLL